MVTLKNGMKSSLALNTIQVAMTMRMMMMNEHYKCQRISCKTGIFCLISQMSTGGSSRVVNSVAEH